jgi:hypothetical protein
MRKHVLKKDFLFARQAFLSLSSRGVRRRIPFHHTGQIHSQHHHPGKFGHVQSFTVHLNRRGRPEDATAIRVNQRLPELGAKLDGVLPKTCDYQKLAAVGKLQAAAFFPGVLCKCSCDGVGAASAYDHSLPERTCTLECPATISALADCRRAEDVLKAKRCRQFAPKSQFIYRPKHFRLGPGQSVIDKRGHRAHRYVSFLSELVGFFKRSVLFAISVSRNSI